MATHEKKTPDWLVERLALGELDADAAAEVRRRLAAEGRDADAELAALAASSREILEAHPPARIAAAVRARAVATRRPSRGFLAALPLVLAGAAAIGLLARPAKHDTTDRAPALEDTIFKGPADAGTAVLGVYRHRESGDERLADGAAAARGDLVQLTYRAGAARFGALLSIDGRGQVTMHWPDSAAAAGRLSEKGEVRLPSAYELDDAPAFERFFLVTADAPFPLASVVEAARALAARPQATRAPLALPASLHQASLTLDKSRKETP
jgi:hypothetical protein